MRETVKNEIKFHSKFMWCLQNIHIIFVAVAADAPFTTCECVDVVLRQFHLALRQ